MKLKYYALLAAAALCVGLTACGGSASSSGASSAAASSQAASSQASSAASAEQTEAVQPLESFTVADPMEDGDYAAGFSADSAEEHEGGYQLTAELYAHDQYDMADVSGLAEGSVIRTHTGSDETQDVTVEKLETGEDGTVTINGGVEEGGMYLTPEDTVYRTLTMDDYPVYYSAGKVTVSLAADVIMNDSSADPQAETVTTEGDAAVAEAIAADETGFTCYNTSITITGGEVTQINRVWVP